MSLMSSCEIQPQNFQTSLALATELKQMFLEHN